jgi:hypothetical protein
MQTHERCSRLEKKNTVLTNVLLRMLLLSGPKTFYREYVLVVIVGGML